NQTWFYPEREISEYELLVGLRSYFPLLNDNWTASGDPLTVGAFKEIVEVILSDVSLTDIQSVMQQAGWKGTVNSETPLNRRWTAVLLDGYLGVFERAIGF